MSTAPGLVVQFEGRAGGDCCEQSSSATNFRAVGLAVVEGFLLGNRYKG